MSEEEKMQQQENIKDVDVIVAYTDIPYSVIADDIYYIIKGEKYALSDHTHGNLSNDGKIGSSGGYIVETGDGGSLKANRRIVVAGTDPSQVTDLSVGDIYIYISDGSAGSADDVINAMLGV